MFALVVAPPNQAVSARYVSYLGAWRRAKALRLRHPDWDIHVTRIAPEDEVALALLPLAHRGRPVYQAHSVVENGGWTYRRDPLP